MGHRFTATIMRQKIECIMFKSVEENSPQLMECRYEEGNF